MAISAETQWSRSRVAGPMPWLWPAQIATDISMTLAAEKPATPKARSNSRSRHGFRRVELLRVEGHQTVAQPDDRAGDRGGIVQRRVPRDGETARRHVEPGMGDARFTPQHGFDQPDAGGALKAVHHQVEGGLSVGCGGGVGGEVGGSCLFIRPERPCIRVDGAARIISIESEALDQAVGRFAA